MHISPRLAILALCASLTGCLQSSTLINVKPDGSGTIEQTVTMSAQAAAQFQQMASGFGQAGDKVKKGGFFSEEELRAAAPKMGEGVTFVSAVPIKNAQVEGTKAIYAFKDITKLRVDQKPSTPSGAGEMGPMGGGAASAAENIGFRFAKTPGGTSVVTVLFPEGKIDKGGKTPAAKQASKKDDVQMQAAALGMMKQFFNGLKVSIVMQPAGRIVKTNSPYVQGQQVTLLEMDFGQLLADETALSKLQGATTIEEAKALMKTVKGAKVNLDREVSVEFAGR